MANEGLSLETMQERWQGLGRTRQLVAIIMAAAILLAVLLLVLTPPKKEYVTLYSNLDAAQASPLLQYLKERGIDFQLDHFGTTIKVPANVADELRIEMAGRGMPFAQGLGFELFDEDQFGLTDFERQVKLQRALQEELRRTITSLDAVIQARVHLAIPEPRVFLRERASPSAAVYLKLNPFVPLREEQVRGIVYLVASSVEDLKPENIVLIDSQGNILYDAVSSADPFTALADSTLKQLEVKRAFEMELERRVQGMLERVFGPGKALALITSRMDFDARETTVITYDEAGVPRSTQVIEERFEGTGPVPGEVGEANYPGYVGVFPGGGESTYERREETINYEISESSERVISAPGKLLSLHTSIVVDTGKSPITAEQIEQVNLLVAAAVGYDPARGDQISVQGMSFDTTFVDEMEAALASLDLERRRQEMFQLAVLGAATLFILILFFGALLRRRRLRERFLVPGEGSKLDELLAAGLSFEEEEVGELVPGETPLARARKLVDENPDLAVFVLRSWMVEES